MPVDKCIMIYARVHHLRNWIFIPALTVITVIEEMHKSGKMQGYIGSFFLNYGPVFQFREDTSIRLNRLPSWISRRTQILSASLPLSRPRRTNGGALSESARSMAWPYTESNQPRRRHIRSTRLFRLVNGECPTVTQVSAIQRFTVLFLCIGF